MKVTLVFPPNRNIPATPYGGLPLLAGCLKDAGHEVDVVDVNLEAFERITKREFLEHCEGYFDHAWNDLRGREALPPNEARRLQGLATLGVVPFEHLYQAEEAGRILRTPELFLDPDKANWAYDVLWNLIRLVYAINPVFQPVSPTYRDDFFGYLESDFDNPISQVVDQVLLEKVLATNPDVVGVAIPFNEQTTEAFALMKQLKRHAPHVKTIVGGAIISAFHRILARDERFYQYADFAMPGEADESLPAFVTALENGTPLEDVPSLYFRREDGEIVDPVGRSLPNLNNLPIPDFTRIPVDRYYLPYPVINYQTSRGCYYGKCTFCSDDIKANFRFRRAPLVIEDLQAIREQAGVRHVMFWDPLTPPRLMRDIAKWNKELAPDEQFYWAAETKFEKVFTEQNFTDLLYAGGARFLQFGYESGSQRVLDLMVKGNDLSRVHLMLNAMRNSGIKVSVQWFIGFPGATEEEDIESYRYLDEHRDAILLSSYMGKFSISADDDIFRSGGDMYDIDLYRRDDGAWDYDHRDGSKHYDRNELDAAMLSRGDAESVTRMHFFIYLTHKPELARRMSNFEKGGILPESWADLEGKKPIVPVSNHLRTYDFDMFTPPEELGITEENPGRLPATPTHAMLVTQTQQVYQLTDDELRVLKLADGEHTMEQILDELGGDRAANQERLYEFVRRGVLVVPLPEPTVDHFPTEVAVAS